MLASQTCNVQNPDLDRVPSVEFIGARVIASEDFKDAFQGGANPRLLHTRALNADNNPIFLELKIENRVWVPRCYLSNMSPSGFRLIDAVDDFNDRRKEIFAAWLGRSYTRVELSDAFNKKFDDTKLKKFFSDIAKRHAGALQGVYFEIRPANADSTETFSPTEIAKMEPPYALHVTFVSHDRDQLALIEEEVEKIDERRIPQPGGKISRREDAAMGGISVTCDAVSIDGWTVRDLMSSIRFTDWDYLSSIDESDM